jgi:hypothetical protein
MKKVLIMMAIISSVFFACGGNNDAEKEKQDSISAAAEADSMLRAEVAADSLNNTADSLKADSTTAK